MANRKKIEQIDAEIQKLMEQREQVLKELQTKVGEEFLKAFPEVKSAADAKEIIKKLKVQTEQK